MFQFSRAVLQLCSLNGKYLLVELSQNLIAGMRYDEWKHSDWLRGGNHGKGGNQRNCRNSVIMMTHVKYQ